MEQCEWGGESDDHVRLKSVLADCIRQSHWLSSIEATPSPFDSGNWRADVLAIDPASRRRVAFEVQLSSMSVDDGIFRTERYQRDNIETLWVSLQKSAWYQKIPSVRVRSPARKTHHQEAAPPQEWAVTDGFRRFRDGEWAASEVRLQRLVAGFLSKAVIPYTLPDRVRGRDAVLLVPAKDVESARIWSPEPSAYGSDHSEAARLTQLAGLQRRNKALNEIRDEWEARSAAAEWSKSNFGARFAAASAQSQSQSTLPTELPSDSAR